MKVSKLYGPNGPVFGKDVYVIGVGSSMRLFPLSYLEDKTCILLNDACRHFPTLGPISLANNRKFIDDVGETAVKYWVIKARLKSDPHPERDDNHVPWDHDRLYCFSYREPPWDKESHFDQTRIWREKCHYWNMPGGNVAIFATQFAVMAGAKAVILVGCDAGEICGQRYVTKEAAAHRIRNTPNSAIKRMGSLRPANYQAYVDGLGVLQRRALADKGVPIMSMTPFVGLKNMTQQFLRWHKAHRKGVDEV